MGKEEELSKEIGGDVGKGGVWLVRVREKKVENMGN